MSWKPNARTEKVLATVHPKMRELMLTLLEKMDAIGLPMTATDGNRTAEEQYALYKQGRRFEVVKDPKTGKEKRVVIGKVVTNADGYRKLSNHQGGRAVDCTFLDENGKAYYPDPNKPADDRMWQEYGRQAKALGLKWGGDFKSLKGGDRPHVEIPEEML